MNYLLQFDVYNQLWIFKLYSFSATLLAYSYFQFLFYSMEQSILLSTSSSYYYNSITTTAFTGSGVFVGNNKHCL